MKINPQENKEMFAGIAKGYDITNDIITLGKHKSWYKKMVDIAGLKPGMRILDCATGTGNVALTFKQQLNEQIDVTGIDVVQEMLDIAKDKAKNVNLDIDFINADILNLPSENESFDVSTISFGIRNVASIESGIKEMTRVLKPGGKILILETGAPQNSFIRFFYNFYQKTFVTFTGTIFTKNKSAYTYFINSTNEFPCGSNFINIMDSLNIFSKTYFKKFMLGTIYLYVGEKIS